MVIRRNCFMTVWALLKTSINVFDGKTVCRICNKNGKLITSNIAWNILGTPLADRGVISWYIKSINPYNGVISEMEIEVADK